MWVYNTYAAGMVLELGCVVEVLSSLLMWVYNTYAAGMVQSLVVLSRS